MFTHNFGVEGVRAYAWKLRIKNFAILHTVQFWNNKPITIICHYLHLPNTLKVSNLHRNLEHQVPVQSAHDPNCLLVPWMSILTSETYFLTWTETFSCCCHLWGSAFSANKSYIDNNRPIIHVPIVCHSHLSIWPVLHNTYSALPLALCKISVNGALWMAII